MDIEELKKKYGEVWTIELGGQTVVFRCPTRVEYNGFQSKTVADPARIPYEYENLAKSVIVHPSVDEFDAMLDKRPGYASKVGSEALRVARDEVTASAKKG